MLSLKHLILDLVVCVCVCGGGLTHCMSRRCLSLGRCCSPYPCRRAEEQNVHSDETLHKKNKECTALRVCNVLSAFTLSAPVHGLCNWRLKLCGCGGFISEAFAALIIPP